MSFGDFGRFINAPIVHHDRTPFLVGLGAQGPKHFVKPTPGVADRYNDANEWAVIGRGHNCIEPFRTYLHKPNCRVPAACSSRLFIESALVAADDKPPTPAARLLAGCLWVGLEHSFRTGGRGGRWDDRSTARVDNYATQSAFFSRRARWRAGGDSMIKEQTLAIVDAVVETLRTSCGLPSHE